MNKKKREREREYNGKKRKREYYKYRTMMSRREITNTVASIGLQRVRYIIMHTIWQRRNASRSLNFILLYIQFGNVTMYQNYSHDVIEKYVVLIRRMSLKNLLLH